MPRAATVAAVVELTATQEEPTRPRPTDANGYALDEWDLPLSGPARLRALAGRTDPASDPSGWTEVAEPPLEVLTVPVPTEDDPPATAPDTPPADPAPTEN